MNRVIIAGSRTFTDWKMFQEKVKEILSNYTDIEIVSGHARGADTMGEWYAQNNNIPLKVFPAQWDTYGKRAGYLRNQQMLDYANEETPVLIAFWDGSSRGTKMMIDIAQRAEAEVHIVRY